MRILAVIFLIYIAVGAFLFLAQRNFIYYPTPATSHPYDEISIKYDDAVVEVVVVNSENKNAILYFGGNGEAVEYKAPGFERIFPGHAVYLMKYRGYGGSAGTPSEEKIYADALNVFDYLDKEYSELSLVGRSLGSGVATYVSSRRSVKRLVLVTPYDSIESLAQKAYPMFPMALLLKDKYDSVGRVNSIRAKTLFLVAENDTVIGKNHSDRLFNAFTQQKPEMVVINDVGHNSISDSQRYNDILSQFMSTDSN